MTGSPRGRDGIRTVRFFVRSENRFAILSSLCRSPKGPDELQESLDISRSTLRRILNEFEDAGWVYTTPPEVYHPILPARLLVDLYGPFLDSTDVVARLSTFYDTLPSQVAREELDQFDVGEVRECLQRIRVTVPSRSEPYAPQQRLRELLEQFDSLRGFVPSINPSVMEGIAEDCVEDISVELVVPTEEIDRLGHDQGPMSESAAFNGPVELWSAATVPAFGLLLAAEVVVLIGYDEYVRPDAIAETPRDCRSIEEWATNRVESAFAEAQEVGVD